ncbi:MAG: MGMT family protein [Patescibacteria group bacterium]
MGKINQAKFSQAVHRIVRMIPPGKVMTYGQVAALLGYPRAAQYVGWVLHWSDFKDVPYQRVVNRFGGLASGYTRGGQLAHKFDLEMEGIKVNNDFTIDLERYLWSPPTKLIPCVEDVTLLEELPFSLAVKVSRRRSKSARAGC